VFGGPSGASRYGAVGAQVCDAVRVAGGVIRQDIFASSGVLYAQSVKTSANVSAAGPGTDAGKEIAGRKCHPGVDTFGLLPAVWGTAARVSDNAEGIHLPPGSPPRTRNVSKAWTGTGYRTRADLGWLSHTRHPWVSQPYEWLAQPDQEGRTS
jgi:hypothetical protein